MVSGPLILNLQNGRNLLRERQAQIPMPHAQPGSLPKDFHRKKDTKESRSKKGALRTIAEPQKEAPK
jgi:hypothetical protein